MGMKAEKPAPGFLQAWISASVLGLQPAPPSPLVHSPFTLKTWLSWNIRVRAHTFKVGARRGDGTVPSHLITNPLAGVQEAFDLELETQRRAGSEGNLDSVSPSRLTSWWPPSSHSHPL